MKKKKNSTKKKPAVIKEETSNKYSKMCKRRQVRNKEFLSKVISDIKSKQKSVTSPKVYQCRIRLLVGQKHQVRKFGDCKESY